MVKMLVLSVSCSSIVEVHHHSSVTGTMLVLSVKWVSLMVHYSRDSPPSCSHSEDVGVICEMGKSHVAV